MSTCNKRIPLVMQINKPRLALSLDPLLPKKLRWNRLVQRFSRLQMHLAGRVESSARSARKRRKMQKKLTSL